MGFLFVQQSEHMCIMDVMLFYVFTFININDFEILGLFLLTKPNRDKENKMEFVMLFVRKMKRKEKTTYFNISDTFWIKSAIDSMQCNINVRYRVHKTH